MILIAINSSYGYPLSLSPAASLRLLESDANRRMSKSSLLKRLRVRWPTVEFPEKLQSSIFEHFSDEGYQKQQFLKENLKKTNSTTVYTQPNSLTSRQATKQYSNPVEMGLAVARDQERTERKLENVDIITYKSSPALYHISHQIMYELTVLEKGFKPWSMLDMGHNVGVAVWAAHNHFGESLGDIVIHEHNVKEYNRTVKLLNLRYGEHIPNVQVRGANSFPRSCNKFDLVTAINYFPYLHTSEVKGWFDKIWDRTEGFLVVADISNLYTSRRIADIRKLFLARYGAKTILAPCPHSQACPMRQKRDPNGCRFVAADFSRGASFTHGEKRMLEDKQSEEYSYLVFSKEETGPDQIHRGFDRILAPVSKPKKSRSATFTLCGHDGMLWKNSVSHKTDKHVLKQILKLRSGDLFDGVWRERGEVKMEPTTWRDESVDVAIERRKARNEGMRERKLVKDMSELIGHDVEQEGEEEEEEWNMREEVSDL
eukprot:sb/3464218/